MKARKTVGVVQVAGTFLRPGENKIVDTDKITPQQRKWQGTLIEIRDLGNGKSQVVRRPV
jgi:hypothetical protein